MADSITERLAQIQRRATRYEIIAIVGEARYLLGYSARLSQSILLGLAQRFGLELVEAAFLNDADAVRYSRADGLVFGAGKLVVRRSGRTEREAIIEGELSTPKGLL